MAVTITETLSALQSAIQALLPVSADPALAPDIRINPTSFRPVGVGGVLAVTQTPPLGDLEARRLSAQLVLRVKATDSAGLSAAESAFSSALVGADPTGLRNNGIFRLRRDLSANDAVFDPLPVGAGKDIHFDVLYEYRKPPSAGEGVIDRVVTHVGQNLTGRTLTPLFTSTFATDDLASFDVIDDVNASEPGDWQYDAVNQEIVQRSASSGGSNNFNASKRGTYLILRAGAVPRLAADFVLTASVRSDVSGGIGLVFRFTDADNYCFFLMNRPAPYRLLAKKVGDVTAFLDSGGASDALGYEPGEWNLLRLLVQGDTFELSINGNVALSARDASIGSAGSVGLMCRNNAGARFRQLTWQGL